MMMRVCAYGRSGRWLLSLAVVLALSACSILPQAEPQSIYTLSYAPAAQSGTMDGAVGTTADPVRPWSLRVRTPYSPRLLAGTRILVQPAPGELSVYKGAAWNAPAPQLLRDHLVDAFRREARLESVSNDSMHLHADLELGGDLNVFQVVYENGVPVVHIQFDALLVQPSGSAVIANRRFDIRQPVDGKDVPEVVRAFARAADTLARDVVTWAVQSGPQASKEL